MILYAESSAVLAWLLNEPGAPAVLQQLRAAERVCTSVLTGVECARALSRARQMGRLSRVEELAASQLLATAEAGWDLFAMTDAVLVRARAPLPNDPVRTLDALHLATALVLREHVGAVTILSLDDRIRVSAAALDFDVVPEASPRVPFLAAP